jgi:hypothetical protein
VEDDAAEGAPGSGDRGGQAAAAAAAAAAATDAAAVVLEGGLTIPGRIASALFPYQLTGVTWLWALHRQRVGGILGDVSCRVGAGCRRVHTSALCCPSSVTARASLLLLLTARHPIFGVTLS